ncbi:hypothetical protein ST37_05960 [Vibrio sp. qd031]|uniref:site-specific integrase n=1 Tax=Vibrio sp. qd031 TaxID=1603038 RepID=UPI000A10778E|nr:site-specific integrase [Vibrio sp. qd031]ORT50941.1 hypothetical protein ST37_05960 [Vibrio sp. qd031]
MDKLNQLLTEHLDCGTQQRRLLSKLLTPFKELRTVDNLSVVVRELGNLYSMVLDAFDNEIDTTAVRHERAMLSSVFHKEELVADQDFGCRSISTIRSSLELSNDACELSVFASYLLARDCIPTSGVQKLRQNEIGNRIYCEALCSRKKSIAREFADENRNRKYDNPAINQSHYLTADEERSIVKMSVSVLQDSGASVSDSKMAVGVLLLMCTSIHPDCWEQTKIGIERGDQLGICLSRGSWTRSDYIPDNAYQRPENVSELMAPHTHRVSLPLPRLLIQRLRDLLPQLGGSFTLAQLLPLESKQVWDWLHSKVGKEVLVHWRTGFSSLRAVSFCHLNNYCDPQTASLILANAEFSNAHHLYYHSHKVAYSIKRYGKALESILGKEFGFPYSLIEVDSSLYHGSEVVADLDKLQSRHDEVGIEIRRLWSKRNFLSEQKLRTLYNLVASVVGSAYATNASLREQSAIENKVLGIGAHDGQVFRVEEKKLCKIHSARLLPLTDYSASLIRRGFRMMRHIRRRLKLPVLQQSDSVLTAFDGNGRLIPLSSTKMLDTLYPNHKVPGNWFRQIATTLIREVDETEPFGIALCGHEPDRFRLESPYYLSSTRCFQDSIEQVQNKLISLPRLPTANLEKQNEKTVPLSQVDRAALVVHRTLPPHIKMSELVSTIKSGASVANVGGLLALTMEDSKRWLLTDESAAALEILTKNKALSRLNQLGSKPQPYLPCHIATHITHALRVTKPLSEKTLTKLLTGTISEQEVQVTVKRVVHRRRTAIGELIEDLKLSGKNSKNYQLPILKLHLQKVLELEDGAELTFDELLQQVHQDLGALEWVCYFYIFKVLTDTQKKGGIQTSTLEDYVHATIYPLIEYCLNIDLEEMMETPEEFSKDFMAFASEQERESKKAESTCSTAVERRTRFLRILLGDKSSGKYGHKVFGVRAKLVSATQFRCALLAIEGSKDLKSPEKTNLKALAILMYRFGLRASEAMSLSVQHINIDCNRLMVRTTSRKRLKTVRSNRILSMFDFLSDEELQILRDCVDFAIGNYQFELFENTPYIRDILRGLFKTVTNDMEFTLHDLRHSYANLYYLMLLQVGIQPVRDYFETKDLEAIRQRFCERNVLGGRTSGALFALCRSMGHAGESTLFRHYIHTADLVYRYHSASGKTLTQKEVSDALNVPFAMFRKRRSRDDSGWNTGLKLPTAGAMPFKQLTSESIVGQPHIGETKQQFAFRAVRATKSVICQLEVGYGNMDLQARFAFKLVGLLSYAQNEGSVLINLAKTRVFRNVLTELISASPSDIERETKLWVLSCNTKGQLNTCDNNIDFRLVSKLDGIALSESPLGFYSIVGGRRQDRIIALALATLLFASQRAEYKR